MPVEIGIPVTQFMDKWSIVQKPVNVRLFHSHFSGNIPGLDSVIAADEGIYPDLCFIDIPHHTLFLHQHACQGRH